MQRTLALNPVHLDQHLVQGPSGNKSGGAQHIHWEAGRREQARDQGGRGRKLSRAPKGVAGPAERVGWSQRPSNAPRTDRLSPILPLVSQPALEHQGCRDRGGVAGLGRINRRGRRERGRRGRDGPRAPFQQWLIPQAKHGEPRNTQGISVPRLLALDPFLSSRKEEILLCYHFNYMLQNEQPITKGGKHSGTSH